MTPLRVGGAVGQIGHETARSAAPDLRLSNDRGEVRWIVGRAGRAPETPLYPPERSSPGLGRPTFRDDVDDDHASLLSGLDITIGIGDRGERISAIDDGNESARFDLVPKSGHERLPAAPLRQGNHDPPVSRYPRPEQEQQILRPGAGIRRREDA